MIRFSAILAVVVAAIGLLVAGAISGGLLLVYLAIGIAALALLMLIAGVLIWRDEIFGETAAVGQTEAAGEALAEPAGEPAPALSQRQDQELPAALAASGQFASFGAKPGHGSPSRRVGGAAEDLSPPGPAWPVITATGPDAEAEPRRPGGGRRRRLDAPAEPEVPAASAAPGKTDVPAAADGPPSPARTGSSFPLAVAAQAAQTAGESLEGSESRRERRGRDRPAESRSAERDAEPAKSRSAGRDVAAREPAESRPGRPDAGERDRHGSRSEPLSPAASLGPPDSPARSGAPELGPRPASRPPWEQDAESPARPGAAARAGAGTTAGPDRPRSSPLDRLAGDADQASRSRDSGRGARRSGAGQSRSDSPDAQRSGAGAGEPGAPARSGSGQPPRETPPRDAGRPVPASAEARTDHDAPSSTSASRPPTVDELLRRVGQQSERGSATGRPAPSASPARSPGPAGQGSSAPRGSSRGEDLDAPRPVSPPGRGQARDDDKTPAARPPARSGSSSGRGDDPDPARPAVSASDSPLTRGRTRDDDEKPAARPSSAAGRGAERDGAPAAPDAAGSPAGRGRDGDEAPAARSAATASSSASAAERGSARADEVDAAPAGAAAGRSTAPSGSASAPAKKPAASESPASTAAPASPAGRPPEPDAGPAASATPAKDRAASAGPASPAEDRAASASPASPAKADEPAPDESKDSGDGDGPSTSSDTQVSVVPGIARYHLPACILIRFLGPEDLEVMTRQAAEAAGCVPCKACRPEK